MRNIKKFNSFINERKLQENTFTRDEEHDYDRSRKTIEDVNRKSNNHQDLENEILDILDFEIKTRIMPYSDDIDVDPKTKEKASKSIVELLKRKGLI